MSNWQPMTIGQFLSLQRGYDLTEDEREVGNIPVVGAAGQNGFHNKALVSAPGIVVGRCGGSFGQVYFAKEDFWPHNTAMFVTDFKGNDPYFAYYLLKNIDFSRLNSGSAQPSLNRNYVYPIKITVPKPPEQRKIAAVLSALDAKIACNNRINAELEAMAKTLYDYWFIQFDFPDANGKPYKSSGGKMVYNATLKRKIPAGWTDCELGDYISFKRGISYKSSDIQNTGVPFINLNSFTLSGEFKIAGTKFFNGKYKGDGLLNIGDLVVAITDVTRNADIIGKSFVVANVFDQKPLISCDVATVSSKTFGVFYLERLFNSSSYHKYIKYFASGTLVLHLDINGINWFKTVLPPPDILAKYEAHCATLLKQREIALKENLQLKSLRDWLLPMLMNGQVTVA